MPAELWTDAFVPRDFDSIVGNIEIVDRAKAWALAWSKGKSQVPLLLVGPPGCGKTALAHVIARQFGWPVFETNASDLRSKEALERVASAAGATGTLAGGHRLILLDEVDGLQSADRGGSGIVLALLRESQNPVVLTANDLYANPNLGPLRTICDVQSFKRINYLSMAKRGREILLARNIGFSEDAVAKLARESGGDFRSFLLDLQFFSADGRLDESAIGSTGARERSMNIFSVLPRILGAKTVLEAREARNAAEVDPDMLNRWIEENLPRRFDSPAGLAVAFEPFSRADVFEGRILRRQHYSFKRYSGDLSTAGVALSTSEHASGFISYQFPGLLRRLSQSKGARQVRLSAAKKISDRSHAGAKEIIRQDWPFLEMMMAHRPWAVAMTHHFGFDEKELGLLLHSKPDSKKVQSILEEAHGALIAGNPPSEVKSKKKNKNADGLSGGSSFVEPDSQNPPAEPLSLTKQKRVKDENELAEESHQQTRLF